MGICKNLRKSYFSQVNYSKKIYLSSKSQADKISIENSLTFIVVPMNLM